MARNKTLVLEKLAQATDGFNEFNINCWLNFVRETSMAAEPI